MQNGDGVPAPSDANNNAVALVASPHRSQKPAFDDELHEHINGISSLQADGRTVSTLEHDSPARGKKRKFDEAESKSRIISRAPSPPWKKVAVEGPTSFVVDGRRKSSRTNMLPLELQPPGERRLTRSSLGHSDTPNGVRKVKSAPKLARTEGQNVAVATPPSNRRPVGRPPKDRSAVKSTPAPSPATEHNTTPTPRTRSQALPNSESPLRNRTDMHAPMYYVKRKYVRKSDSAAKEAPVQPSPSEGPTASVEATPTKIQRIRLRVRPPKIPVFNPGHLLPVRRHPSLKHWLEADDPLAGEEDARITQAQAPHEARIRQRLIDAGKPGGALSREKCSLYDPEPQEEPPMQYGHMNHLAAHAVHFRTLMNRERRRHEHAAKKLSHEAVERWKQIQERKRKQEEEQRRKLKASRPKTIEDIWEEEHENAKTRYEQLIRDLTRQWDLVRKAVQDIRLIRWDEEQQALGKQALNNMLDRSTKLLDKRRLRASSDASTTDGETELVTDGSEVDGSSEGGEEDASDSDNETVDSANMSSTGTSSQSGFDDETNLTVEELRQRYPGVGLKGLPSRDNDDEQYQANYTPVPSSPSRISEDDAADTRDDEGAFSASESGSVLRPKNGINQKPINGTLKDPDLSFSLPRVHTAELDEVDPILLDDFDNSTDDMDEDMGESENEDNEEIQSEAEDDSEAEDSEESSEGGEMGNSMLGFFGKADLDEMKAAADSDSEVEEKRESSKDRPRNERARRDSAARVTSTSEGLELCTAEIDNGATSPPDRRSFAVDTQSANPSVQPSPMVSTNAKPTDADSVSSIEMQDEAGQPTSDAIPTGSVALKTKVPSLLRGTLREYQHFGLDWLARLYATNTNGILADEMGLGKTIQTISLLAHLAVHHEVWGPHLVIVPTSVMLNWEVEFKKWCPGFKILTYYGNVEERKRKRHGWLNEDRWNVFITSYQLVLQDEAVFKRRNWHYLILDEAHNIKNFQTQRWQKLLGFKTHSRLLLTGTPLQNNLTELWSLLFFLMPHGFDQGRGFAGLQDFLKAVRRPADQILDQGRDKLDSQAQETVSKLHEVLRPYLLRRLKADVEKQMPAKYEHVVYCRLSKRQRQLYDGFMGRADTKRTLASGNYMSIINCLMSLRKVCNHPDLFETRQIVTSFAMPKSAVADFEIKELLVRKRLLEVDSSTHVNLDALNLVPVANESGSMLRAIRSRHLDASKQLKAFVDSENGQCDVNAPFDGSSIQSVYSQLEAAARRLKTERLKSFAQLTKSRAQKWPIYGTGLVELLNLKLEGRLVPRQPPHRAQLCEWFLNSSSYLQSMVLTTEQRSGLMEAAIRKFGCITPAVVTSDVNTQTLTPKGVELVRHVQQSNATDPFHEARIRLSIAFPDKRLLQYDCGKLQRLEKLLRQLQAGGHRALIFTQMTKVLDILEQFLNIYGYRYLRLDGSTRIEQRQVLTDRFNNDPRILVFILSSRSGGLGINLTGADTVIFYDLDWNPAMDKQCQDRCHRIGQTRDVHIYKFVCEYTIEANILRKSNQKRLLDDVIIQKGDFTTDYFNRLTYKDALDDDDTTGPAGDTEAGAAMDKVLGDMTGLGKVLESVEDKEDTEAAKAAQKEMVHVDEDDFAERDDSRPSGTPKTSVPPTPVDGGGARDEAGSDARGAQPKTATPLKDEVEPKHVDEYMLRFVDEVELGDVPLGPPPDRSKKKTRRGQEHRVRVRRR